jgi:membrane fusion protein (multidrug efflux system)
VRVDAAGLEVESSLTGLVPDVDELSRLAPVWVRMDNRDGTIKPGMSVVGLVPTGRMAMRLTVHKDAILRDDAGEFVYFNAGGRAAPARIERLFAVGDRVAIRDGALPPGAELVVEGNERLFPGQPLNVTNGEREANSSGEGSG